MADQRLAASAVALLLALAGGALAAGDVPGQPQQPACYAAPDGSPENSGAQDSPWDIASALGGKHKVEPGATVFLRSGVYRHRADTKAPWLDRGEQFEVKLVGVKDRPIHVRPFPGEHVIIDGGLRVIDPSTELWVWDLEILVSEPHPTEPTDGGSHPESFTRPWGGLNVMGGKGLKFINMVIHDCRQGVSWWSLNSDTELYAAVIYDNGWPGKDRGHGHAIYTQNRVEAGHKWITDCIITGGRSYSMHAYGSRQAYVDNYVMEGNIVYKAGTFLVGGGNPSRGIRLLKNCLYGVSAQIGYNAPHNEDCEVRGNIIVNGGLSVNKYRRAVQEDNLLIPQAGKRPTGARVVLRPSKYDPNRAHLAIYNWDKSPKVAVDVGDFLKPGECYRLCDPKRLFGPPVTDGVFKGGPLAVPVEGEFAAFVLVARFGPADEARWRDAQRLRKEGP